MAEHSPIPQLEILRKAEKEQALVYRDLAARAEESGDPELAQRFHDLHADEQHHLSRLTARILELGGMPADLGGVSFEPIPLTEWQESIREREEREIRRYHEMLDEITDGVTRALLDGIVEVEAQHVVELGGKWTLA